MLIVTGGIACGKSTFLEVAKEMGLVCLDADEWYKWRVHTGFFDYMRTELFGDVPLKDVAFKHPLWKHYEYRINGAFFIDMREKMSKEPLDIIAIPDYYSKEFRFAPDIAVLSIERQSNLHHALERDGHRDPELTKLIYQNQMSSIERAKQADYVLFNERKTKEEFKKDCERWLKLRLQVVLTRPI